MDNSNVNSEQTAPHSLDQGPNNIQSSSDLSEENTGSATDAESESKEAEKPQNHCVEIVDPKTGAVYHIIGTAHVSEASRAEVERLIEEFHPDKVCVELCQERYDSFYDTNRWKKLNIFDVIRKGKFLYLLANNARSARNSASNRGRNSSEPPRQGFEPAPKSSSSIAISTSRSNASGQISVFGQNANSFPKSSPRSSSATMHRKKRHPRRSKNSKKMPIFRA